MARTRAKDYDFKRAVLLHRAAQEFAREGYDRASMAGLAAQVGVSKSLLYHYYENKEAILFAVIHEHLQTLLAAVELADQGQQEPEQRLSALIMATLDVYRDADAQHKLQLEALPLLPETQQLQIKAMERRLVNLFANAIVAVNPDLAGDDARLKPATMSLFGVLNWVYQWFRDGGPMSREEYARMTSTLFVHGVRALTQ